jgi:hypothetical protein
MERAEGVKAVAHLWTAVSSATPKVGAKTHVRKVLRMAIIQVKYG